MIPEFIGYKLASSEPVGCIADRESALELYKLVTPCLNELFGSSGICVGLDKEEGQRLFSEAASGSEYIYIRYHVPVMYQLIFAYASESWSYRTATSRVSEATLQARISAKL